MKPIYQLITDTDPERFAAKVTEALGATEQASLVGGPFHNPAHGGGLCQAIVSTNYEPLAMPSLVDRRALNALGANGSDGAQLNDVRGTSEPQRAPTQDDPAPTT